MFWLGAECHQNHGSSFIWGKEVIRMDICYSTGEGQIVELSKLCLASSGLPGRGCGPSDLVFP